MRGCVVALLMWRHGCLMLGWYSGALVPSSTASPPPSRAFNCFSSTPLHRTMSSDTREGEDITPEMELGANHHPPEEGASGNDDTFSSSETGSEGAGGPPEARAVKGEEVLDESEGPYLSHLYGPEPGTGYDTNASNASLSTTTGAPKYKHPRFPEYSDNDERLATFSTWPSHLCKTPADLSQAGFFYEGKEDKVQCFFCSKKVYGWEESDDPWKEHARLSPTCRFVMKEKGEDFIRMASGKG